MAMSKKDCTHIFERIAAENHITVAEVCRNIEAAIQKGMADPDPEVRAQWARVPCKGAKLTPDELLRYAVRQAKNENVGVLLRRYFKW